MPQSSHLTNTLQNAILMSSHVQSPLGTESPLAKSQSDPLLKVVPLLSMAALQLQQEKEELRRFAVDGNTPSGSHYSDQVRKEEKEGQSELNLQKEKSQSHLLLSSSLNSRQHEEEEMSVSRTLEALDLDVSFPV